MPQAGAKQMTLSSPPRESCAQHLWLDLHGASPAPSAPALPQTGSHHGPDAVEPACNMRRCVSNSIQCPQRKPYIYVQMTSTSVQANHLHSREHVYDSMQMAWIGYMLIRFDGYWQKPQLAEPMCEVAKGETYFCFCSSTSSCLRLSASSSRSFFDRNFGCSSKQNLQDCTDGLWACVHCCSCEQTTHTLASAACSSCFFLKSSSRDSGSAFLMGTAGVSSCAGGGPGKLAGCAESAFRLSFCLSLLLALPFPWLLS